MGFLGDIVNDSRSTPTKRQPISKTVAQVGQREQYTASDVAVYPAVDTPPVVHDNLNNTSDLPVSADVSNSEPSSIASQARLHSTIDSNSEPFRDDVIDDPVDDRQQITEVQVESVDSISADYINEQDSTESATYTQKANPLAHEQKSISSIELNDYEKFQQKQVDEDEIKQSGESDNLFPKLAASETTASMPLTKKSQDGLHYTIKSEVVNRAGNTPPPHLDFEVNLRQAVPSKEQPTSGVRSKQSEFTKQEGKSIHTADSSEELSAITDFHQQQESNSQQQKETSQKEVNIESTIDKKTADAFQQPKPAYETPAERFARKLQLQQSDKIQAVEQVQQYGQQQARQLQQALSVSQQTPKTPSRPRVHIGQIDIIVQAEESSKPKQVQQNSVKKSPADLWYLKSL